MFQFLTVIFTNVISALEESSKRKAKHYINNFTNKGLWK